VDYNSSFYRPDDLPVTHHSNETIITEMKAFTSTISQNVPFARRLGTNNFAKSLVNICPTVTVKVKI